MRNSVWCAGLASAAFLLMPGAGQAHESGLSYLDVQVDGGLITASLDAPAVDYARGMHLDVDRDGQLSAATVSTLKQWLFGNVRFVANGEVCDGDASTPQLDKDGLLSVTGTWKCPQTQSIQALDLMTRALDTFGGGHSMFVRVAHGKKVRQALLTNKESSVSFEFVASESWVSAALRFVKLGVEHIFEGVDHILFLLALLVLGGSLWRILGIATAFTAAHSVTLSLAALNIVVLPGRFVESTIALSIGWVAAENWIFAVPRAGKQEPLVLRWRWVLTFMFGLVHGFGFADVLRDLGLPKEHLAVTLASFNVGVELGQVAIITIAYPLLKWAARTTWYRPLAVRMASVLMIVIALYWFVERAFELG